MIARARQLAGLALWAIVISIVASFISGGGRTSGQGMNHAGLVVAFPDGRVETRCISFSEESISGAELLERSGMPVVFSGFGGLGSGVCRIDDTGCSDPGDCFCQCRGADCAYWSYYALTDGEWRYQPIGAGGRRIHHGDIDGWVWGSGHAPPPPSSYDEVCAPPTATRAPPAATAPPVAVGRPTAGPAAATSQPPGGGEAGATPAAPQLTADAGGSERTPTASLATGTPLRSTPGSEVRAQAHDTPANPAQASVSDDGGGSGAPVGLIVFGIVAGALIVATGGLVLRKRFVG